VCFSFTVDPHLAACQLAAQQNGTPKHPSHAPNRRLHPHPTVRRLCQTDVQSM
jgi:hypothetical protein